MWSIERRKEDELTANSCENLCLVTSLAEEITHVVTSINGCVSGRQSQDNLVIFTFQSLNRSIPQTVSIGVFELEGTNQIPRRARLHTQFLKLIGTYRIAI